MKDRMKQLRKSLNLKQRDIAERLGVDVSTVGGWECGRTASESNIRQLCKEYNVNRGWLETGEGEMFEPEQKSPVKGSDEEKLKEAAYTLYKKLPGIAQKAVLASMEEIVKNSQSEGSSQD